MQKMCSRARWDSWMFMVVVEGITMLWSQRSRILPPPEPEKPMEMRSCLRAWWRALRMLGELPEVEMPRKTSPGWPKASIWRAKTWSKPKSLPQAVRMEVSVVRATARRAARLVERRTTNSATRYWASAAEPPLPATRSLLPDFRASAVSWAMVTMVSEMDSSARTACRVAMD